MALELLGDSFLNDRIARAARSSEQRYLFRVSEVFSCREKTHWKWTHDKFKKLKNRSESARSASDHLRRHDSFLRLQLHPLKKRAQQ